MTTTNNTPAERIAEFKSKVAKIVTTEKNDIKTKLDKSIAELDSILLIPFDNESPYTGDTKNLIFMTYDDCYKGNSATRMSIGELHNAHFNMDDRGYIKGVATDLSGYMAMRAMRPSIWFDGIGSYFPKFIKSKKQSEYNASCDVIAAAARAELATCVERANKLLDGECFAKTGCSFLHYMTIIS